MEKNIICTVCPRGCHVKVTLAGKEVTEVADYGCKRGKEYAAAEATHPVRILTTTVKISDQQNDLLPLIITEGIHHRPRCIPVKISTAMRYSHPFAIC